MVRALMLIHILAHSTEQGTPTSSLVPRIIRPGSFFPCVDKGLPKGSGTLDEA